MAKKLYGRRAAFQCFMVLGWVAFLAQPLAAHAFQECATDLHHPDPAIATKIWQACEAINRERANQGLSPLLLVVDLHRVAQAFGEKLRNSGTFSHTGPDGSSLMDRIARGGVNMQRAYGYRAGENLASGLDDPQAVVSLWMSSEGHRANILNAGFSQMGIGAAAPIWVADFSN